MTRSERRLLDVLDRLVGIACAGPLPAVGRAELGLVVVDLSHLEGAARAPDRRSRYGKARDRLLRHLVGGAPRPARAPLPRVVRLPPPTNATDVDRAWFDREVR